MAGFNLVDYSLVGAAFFALWGWATGRRRIYLAGWMLLPFLAALSVTSVDVIVSGSRSGQAEELVRILIATTVIVVLLTSVAATEGRSTLLTILKWWTVGVAINAAGSVAVSLGVVSFAGLLQQPTGSRLSGLSSHPNSVAFSISLALPVLIYLCQAAAKIVSRAFWLVMIFVCIWGLVLSDSRSGLLIAIAGSAVSLILLLANSKIRILSLPLLVLGVLAVASVLPEALRDTRLVTGSDQSNFGRAEYANNAWDLFSANPILGAGLGEQTGVAVPLQLLSGGGLLLALAYYLFVLWPLSTLWKARVDRLAQTSMVVLGAFISFGFLNPTVFERAALWPVLIGALCWISARAGDPGSNPWRIASGSQQVFGREF